MKTKSIRLHHRNRILNKRIKQLKERKEEMSKDDFRLVLLKSLDTPNPCACWMCGNPRKFFNKDTVQEKRWKVSFLDLH